MESFRLSLVPYLNLIYLSRSRDEVGEPKAVRTEVRMVWLITEERVSAYASLANFQVGIGFFSREGVFI